MYKLKANSLHKKILLISVVFFCCFTSNSFGEKNKDQYTAINNKLNHIFLILDGRSFPLQEEFYKLVKERIAEKKQFLKKESQLELILYIEKTIDERFGEYKKTFLLSKEGDNKISPHKTLLLRFSRGGNHSNIISRNKDRIEKNGSVFLFKKGSDLSKADIRYITSEIIKLNSNILIFIDQEGGWINRYVEFEKSSEVDRYFTDSEIDIKIKSLFPLKNGYFPSLTRIGNFYDSFTTEEEKKYFLEKIAFIRLQTLKNNSINTYGLVLDLNRGNPVITGNSRSFSRHLDKYKKLVDAFTLASKKTGVILYFKHFPGHGAGNVDSHKAILNLAGQEKYLKENLELFSYALDFNPKAGAMVAHAYIPSTLQSIFNNGVSKTHFLLTDDLGMRGYKLAKGKIKKDLFFTTDSIGKNKALIIVDSHNADTVK